MNSSNSILKEVYFKHIVPIEASLPGTTLEALEMTCTHSKFATMSFDTLVVTNLKYFSCSLQKMPNVFMSFMTSMAIKKNSPYKEILRIT
ncbi:hypothetical protein ANN_00842 [Periplaneta americana]|uniref:Uncharacterized protein n=1 Tax=Periplaneta americana TaxID=6978 RepID=A0ABQ8TRX0_PERAM|nr:hypothetical protein ANN_00842 [Periplaneta americana]